MGKALQVASLVLRGVAMLFGVIVSAAIADKARGDFSVEILKREIDITVCYYGNYNACGYAIGIGVFALVVAFVFLLLDLLFMWKTSVKEKIGFCATVADIAASALLVLLWFVSLVFLWANWSESHVDYVESLETKSGDNIPLTASAARAGIAFSALSLFVWILLLVFAVLRLRSLRQGTGSASGEKSADSGEEKKTPAPV